MSRGLAFRPWRRGLAMRREKIDDEIAALSAFLLGTD
jgi:hypothetical protein